MTMTKLSPEERALRREAQREVVDRLKTSGAMDEIFAKIDAGEQIGGTGTLTENADLTRTIAWALNEDVITRPEATLLATIYGTSTGARGSYGFETAATHLGITPAAVRQRCSRTIRKITTAIRADLDDADQALLTA